MGVNTSAGVAVGGAGDVPNGDKGDIVVSASGRTWTIDSGVVTLAKMANLAQDQFIVRTTASTGVPETATVTAAARTVLDDTTVAAMRNTLGLGTSWDLIHRTTPPVWCTDFMHNNPVQKDFTGGAISSGTIASGVAASIVANHPGVMQLSSSTTPNSGYQFIVRGASILLAGSEQMDVVLYTPAAIDANTTIRLGFGDTVTSADNTDGVYFIIANTTARGWTASNSSRNSTATTYTVSAGTWYHFRVSLNSDATTATFKIFNDSGTELFSDTVSATIPTASGRELGGGIVATNSGSSAVALVNIDYICVSLGRTLTRGALT